MSLHQKDSGTRVTAANVGDVTDDLPADSDPWVKVLETLVERTEYSGGSDATAKTGDDKVKVAFRAGEVVRKSALLAKMTAGDVTSFTPKNGLNVAGGTTITAKGTGLDGVTGVTVGGVAATSVTVVDSSTVTFVTPARAAGTYAVVLADDAGAITENAALTFA